MSDEVLESGQEVQEPVAQPAPTAPSVPSGVQQTSAQESEADVLDRLAQSIKDKRFASQEKQITALTEQVNKLVTVVSDQSVAESSPPVQGRTDSGGEPNQAYMEAMSAQLLEGAGIAFDDPEYNALAEQYGGRIANPEQWVGLVREFASKRSSKAVKQASVTEAADVGTSGSVTGATGTESVEDIATELEAIQMGDKGSPFTPENEKRMQELSEELNKLEPKIDLDDPNVIVDRASLARLYK